MSINDISFSEAGRIILNPILFDLPGVQQIFWYTHERAHQIFGRSEEVTSLAADDLGHQEKITALTRVTNFRPGKWPH